MDLSGTTAAQLFWDVAPERIADLPEGFVIPRVMERGTLADYRWLLRTCPADRLTAWYRSHAARHLSPRSLALWACLLDCPRPTPTQVPWHA